MVEALGAEERKMVEAERVGGVDLGHGDEVLGRRQGRLQPGGGVKGLEELAGRGCGDWLAGENERRLWNFGSGGDTDGESGGWWMGRRVRSRGRRREWTGVAAARRIFRELV